MLRDMRIYLLLLGTHLRAALEYEADFWIMAFGAAMTQLAGFLFIALLYLRVPTINGWNFWSVALLFGLVALTEGLLNLFCEGMWGLTQLKHEGDLDYMLVRPYPVVLQVLSARIGLNGLGNVLIGGGTTAVALSHLDIAWSPLRAVVAVVLLISAVAIRAAIMLTANTTSLWVDGPGSMFAFSVHQVGDLVRYPLAIYPMALKGLLVVVLPFAFVSFFPVSWLTGEGDHAWVGLLTPLVAAYTVAVALWVFRRGLLRYESAGN